MTLSVVTWLWHDEAGRWNKIIRYSPDMVNRLAAMVRANLSMPHQFVVVTDQVGADFDSRIKVVSLWPEARHLGGCWCRLKAFHRPTALLLGERFVSVDLDCVVTGDLTPIFARTEDAVFWEASTSNTPYNGSMWMLTAGARQQVWDRFDPTTSPEIVREAKMIGTDQAWMSYVLSNEATWRRQSDGVLRFGGDCNHGLPDGARIVFFPGRPKPNDVMTRMQHPWIEQCLTLALPLQKEQLYSDQRSEARLSRAARHALKQVRVLEKIKLQQGLTSRMRHRLKQAKGVLARDRQCGGVAKLLPRFDAAQPEPPEPQEAAEEMEAPLPPAA